MTYRVHLLKFFFAMEDHFHRIQKAERTKHLWKWCTVLCLASIVLYGWMAYLGIGSDMISSKQSELTLSAYEGDKFGFLLGRMLYAMFVSVIVLFFSAALFYVFTGIPFQKLVVMQQAVLYVLLIERLLWIPFMLYLGLDWYVSPLSFGIIVSYITTSKGLIYFFGAISLVQLWAIRFQFKYIDFMAPIRKRWIMLMVIGVHVFYWAVAATIALVGNRLIGGLFG